MKGSMRHYLLWGFMITLGGMAVAALAGSDRATAGSGGGEGSCAIRVPAAPADPVSCSGGACSVSAVSGKAESPVVLNAAEVGEAKAETMEKTPACGACKAAGGMCSHCKAAQMQKGGMKLEALKTSLDAAKAALESGDTKTAMAELTKAQALVVSMQEMHKKMIAAPAANDGKAVNAKCPIMGSKIDPANVPANLTRVFKGQTVGFCCGGCPAAWDKLTDDQKQAKLDAVMK